MFAQSTCQAQKNEPKAQERYQIVFQEIREFPLNRSQCPTRNQNQSQSKAFQPPTIYMILSPGPLCEPSFLLQQHLNFFIITYWFIAVAIFFFSPDYKNAFYTTSLRILGSLFLQMVSLTALTTYLFSEQTFSSTTLHNEICGQPQQQKCAWWSLEYMASRYTFFVKSQHS